MKQKRDPAQTSFTEECILDGFAGGGGKIETMDQLKRIVSA